MMKRAGRGLTSLWLVGCLGFAGCKKEEPPPPHPAAELPAPEDSPAQPGTPPPGTIPREGEAAAKPPVHVVVPADGGTPGSTAGQQPAPTPAPTGAAGVPAEDLKNREWTAGNVELKRPPGMPVTMRSVRLGQHAGYDRVVFEFEGTQLPGYALEYVDKPIIQCGSGDPTPVAGDSWLQVRFMPARAHDDQGQPTIAEREMKPGLPVVVELERTCNFEGEVTWVLGNKRPNKYRVMELREPARVVVDVQH
jgi:hypothetical protein